MSLAERIARRRHDPGPPEPTIATAGTREGPADPDELRRRRDSLARRFADLQWDLGGVVYEMASRDHFRLDVVARQAAQLQEVDAELAGVERLLRLEEAGAAGACETCGALYARGAVFCWSCGGQLLASAPAGASPAEPAPPRPAEAETA